MMAPSVTTLTVIAAADPQRMPKTAQAPIPSDSSSRWVRTHHTIPPTRAARPTNKQFLARKRRWFSTPARCRIVVSTRPSAAAVAMKFDTATAAATAPTSRGG